MSNYTTPKPFMDLFFDFTGYSHADYPQDQTAIAQDLAKRLAENLTGEEEGPLVVANSVGIYVYSPEPGHKLLASQEYRAAPNSGFYEVTSLSHVGPAIAYLGVLQKYGDDVWQTHLAPMIEHLHQIREENAKPMAEHWLSALDYPAWRGHEAKIKNLIDYACGLAGNYLSEVAKNKSDFCPEHIVKHFLEVETEAFPISYNTVMIGTFSLAGLKGAYDIYSALNQADINWPRAKVLLQNLAGTNYSAGLTPGSNWLYPLIRSIAGEQLPKERIFVVPYAPELHELGKPNLSDAQYGTLAYQVWGAIYSRPLVTNEAFGNVPDISVPRRPAIPGDYEFTRADQINHFMQRLKFSTGNIKEMLSNTVGFWLAGEAENKNWQLDQMAIPGLTHGLPEGFDLYPDNLPDFNKD